jgi:hypothetical protein
MTSRDFCYWLQGFFELQGTNQALTPEQVQIIRNHLKLVFLHEIDPSYSDNKIVQQIFQNIHDGKDPLNCVDAELVKPSDRPTLIARC